MKVLHLNAGNETGGGMYHILRLLGALMEADKCKVVLGVFEKKELYGRARSAQFETVYFKGEKRFDLAILWRIAAYIKREKITHVHTHGPRANVYMRLLRRFVGVHWVVTVHSDPFVDFSEAGMKGRLFTRLQLWAVRRADDVISVCDAFRPGLKRSGVREKQLTTIRNGIDFFTDQAQPAKYLTEQAAEFIEDETSLREMYHFEQSTFLLLSVARLEAVKGIELLLRAFAAFSKSISSRTHLLLVGDGSLRCSLEALTEKLEIKHLVTFYGEQRDVGDFYQLADLLVLASLSESFPYVLLEAARAGTPVIATDVGDVGKLITGEALGFKVAPGSAEALEGAMRQAFADEVELAEIGKRLQKIAGEKFSLAKCADEVYNVYISAKY